MPIYTIGTKLINDAPSEPVSLTEMRNWLRLDPTDTSDDALIGDLISAARQHIENIASITIVNKTYSTSFEVTGVDHKQWIIRLPYGPLVSVTSVKYQEGINSFSDLVADSDYEVYDGKLLLYKQGIFKVQYVTGFGSVPYDLKNDIMTLTAWMYENRGKMMNVDNKSKASTYPFWDGLNYHQYKNVMI